MASRFLVFFLFGVVLARPFFPIFRQWIPKRCKRVHCVDLGEELSNDYLLAKFGFDTAENEPYYFASSSSREFEFELWNFEPHLCKPASKNIALNVIAQNEKIIILFRQSWQPWPSQRGSSTIPDRISMQIRFDDHGSNRAVDAVGYLISARPRPRVSPYKALYLLSTTTKK